MARIMPSLARAHPRIFSPPQQYATPSGERGETDTDQALKTVQAVRAGIGALSEVWDLGTDVYDALAPTEAQRLAERQAQESAIQSRIAAMEGARAPALLDAERRERPALLDRSEGARQDYAREAAHLRPPEFVREARGLRRQEAEAPILAQAPAPQAPAPQPPPKKQKLITPQWGHELFQMMRDHGVTEEFIASGNFTATEGEPFEHVLVRLPKKLAFREGMNLGTDYQRDAMGEILKRLPPELVPGFAQKAKAALNPQVAPYAEEDLGGLNVHQQAFARSMEPREGAGPRLAADYIRDADRREAWSTSDLAADYGTLMAAGREAEARELLNIVRGAQDYASFIKTHNDPPQLVEARAREAVKKGVQPGWSAADFKTMESLRTKGRRKGRGGSGGSKDARRPKAGSPLTSAEKSSLFFQVIAAEDSIPAARDYFYNPRTKRSDGVARNRTRGEARRLIDRITSEASKSDPRYEGLRKWHGPDWLGKQAKVKDTDAAEQADQEALTDARKALGDATGLTRAELEDQTKAKATVAEMEKKLSLLPEGPALTERDYTWERGEMTFDEFKATSAYTDQTSTLRKGRPAALKARRRIAEDIRIAKDAMAELWPEATSGE